MALAYREIEWPNSDIYMSPFVYIEIASLCFTVLMVREFLPQVSSLKNLVAHSFCYLSSSVHRVMYAFAPQKSTGF